MKKQKLIDKIMNAGLKNTKYRVYIIDLLSKSERLMSAQDIYLELMKKKLILIYLQYIEPLIS